MTNFNRMLQSGQLKAPMFISFDSSLRIANRVRAEFATSRRASVSSEVLGRVLNAMVNRRLQPASTSPYAVKFDELVHTMGGIVPAFMNNCLTTIPLNGVVNIQGEFMRVSVFPKDKTQDQFYLTSGQFITDMLTLKTYSQAQGVVFVQINPLVPFTQPSLSKVLFDPGQPVGEIGTIPLELRTAISTDRILTTLLPTSGRIDNEALIEDVSPQDAVLYATGAKTIRENKIIRTIDGDYTVYYTVTDPLPHYGININQFLIRTSSKDDILSSISQSSAAMWPITIIGQDNNDPVYTDLALQTKTLIRFDDNIEYEQFIEQACTQSINKFAADVAVAAQNAAGGASTRNPTQQLIPSVGIDPINRIQPTPQQGDRSYPEDLGGYYPTSERGSGNQQQDGGLQRPTPGRGRGGRGNRDRAARGVRRALFNGHSQNHIKQQIRVFGPAMG